MAMQFNVWKTLPGTFFVTVLLLPQRVSNQWAKSMEYGLVLLQKLIRHLPIIFIHSRKAVSFFFKDPQFTRKPFSIQKTEIKEQ